jgi:hypothetical protein
VSGRIGERPNAKRPATSVAHIRFAVASWPAFDRQVIIFERYANAKCAALGHAHVNLLLNGKHVNHSSEQSFGSVASRRGVLRGLTSAASALALCGCAGMASEAPRFDASDLVTSPTLLVATTRRPANGARAKPWFGPERASKMTVARARLTPPPDDGRFSLASVGLVDWQFETIEPSPRSAI